MFHNQDEVYFHVNEVYDNIHYKNECKICLETSWLKGVTQNSVIILHFMFYKPVKKNQVSLTRKNDRCDCSLPLKTLKWFQNNRWGVNGGEAVLVSETVSTFWLRWKYYLSIIRSIILVTVRVLIDFNFWKAFKKNDFNTKEGKISLALRLWVNVSSCFSKLEALNFAEWVFIGPTDVGDKTPTLMCFILQTSCHFRSALVQVRRAQQAAVLL